MTAYDYKAQIQSEYRHKFIKQRKTMANNKSSSISNCNTGFSREHRAEDILVQSQYQPMINNEMQLFRAYGGRQVFAYDKEISQLKKISFLISEADSSKGRQ